MNTILYGPTASPLALTSTPEQVMDHFFNAFSQQDLQNCLWDLFETAMVTDYGLFDEADQRSMLMCVYTDLLEVIDAGMKIYGRVQKV